MKASHYHRCTEGEISKGGSVHLKGVQKEKASKMEKSVIVRYSPYGECEIIYFVNYEI